jgi:hypothetical protein
MLRRMIGKPLRKPVSAPGCDDAPIVTVGAAKMPKGVTLIMPYYENHDTLAAHLARWREWPDEVRHYFQAIIVDDGSPNWPAHLVLRGAVQPFPIRLFRIDVDIRWNWLAARNLAFAQADGGWCFVTDIDHILPLETAGALVTGDHDKGVIYRFARQEHTGEAIAPHPNSWFMTKDMFWKVGGHDEALSGYYGTDGEYRRRAAKTAPIRILTDRLIRQEHVGDSSTTRYLRKQPQDVAVTRIISARQPGWKPKTLSFPWHEVMI